MCDFYLSYYDNEIQIVIQTLKSLTLSRTLFMPGAGLCIEPLSCISFFSLLDEAAKVTPERDKAFNCSQYSLHADSVTDLACLTCKRRKLDVESLECPSSLNSLVPVVSLWTYREAFLSFSSIVGSGDTLTVRISLCGN